MTIEKLYEIFLKQGRVSTDTRNISQGDIFFALKGETFNGNLFAAQALKNGASYSVVDEDVSEENSQIIRVENVLETLQNLANFHRRALKTPVIALTGSNGKTTTKELINSVLSQKYKTLATKGNLNNHIGVPLTLLNMTKETEIAIVEMGANHLGEIKALCMIAEPDFGVITNFGKAHLEGFGSVEGVIRGKSELYNHLKDNNKLIFLNTDDLIQVRQLGNYPNFYGFGENDKGDVDIQFLSADPKVKASIFLTNINSNLIGSYNYTNMAIAMTIGHYFKVAKTDIKKGIETYIPQNNRSQIIFTKGYKIILDAYNANPSSMEAAISNFEGLNDKKKLAVLGDMFELGDVSSEEHQRIATMLETAKNIEGILVGENFYKTNTRLLKFKNFDDLRNLLIERPLKNRTLLIKGSRGMALERILDIL